MDDNEENKKKLKFMNVCQIIEKTTYVIIVVYDIPSFYCISFS